MNVIFDGKLRKVEIDAFCADYKIYFGALNNIIYVSPQAYAHCFLHGILINPTVLDTYLLGIYEV